MKYKIRNFRRTLLACPSQWEIELKDRRWMYVRYRWGCLAMGIGKTVDDAVASCMDKPIFSRVVGSGSDGYMNNFEMAKHVGLIGRIPKDKEIRFEVPWVRELAKKLKSWDKK